MADDPLDIPDFLRLTRDERRQTWTNPNRARDSAPHEGVAPATEETDVKKAAIKARKADRRQNPGARTAQRAATQANRKAEARVAKVDVVAKIAGMMARKGGASMDEMVAATGIQPHPMRTKIKLVRDRLGYATVAPCKDNGYRYHATPPKAKTSPTGLDGDGSVPKYE